MTKEENTLLLNDYCKSDKKELKDIINNKYLIASYKNWNQTKTF